MNDALISTGDLLLLELELRRRGNFNEAKRLRAMEPELYAYIDYAIKHMAGELTLNRVPANVAARASNHVMTLVVTVLEATYRATYRTWADTLKGTPLEHLRSLFPENSDQDDEPPQVKAS